MELKQFIYQYGWQSLVIFEGLLILYLAFKLRKSPLTPLEKKMNSYKKGEVDMDALMMDMNKSKALYKELTRKYHPDRFIGTNMREAAELFFKEIQKNRTSYAQLSRLQKEAVLKFKNN